MVNNALAAWALQQTPLQDLTALSQTPWLHYMEVEGRGRKMRDGGGRGVEEGWRDPSFSF